MKITVSIPFYAQDSGGIMRQTTLAKKLNKLWTVEVPKYLTTSGGVNQMYDVACNLKKKYDVHLRIQTLNPKLDYSKIDFEVPYSVGLTDSTFPESDIVITYSDNPYTDILTSLPQVKKVLIYMLSYGMCLERERKNVLNPKVTVMSSTIRTQRLIEKEGVKCHYVGFGLDMNFFYENPSIKRERYAALLYHYSLDKQYELGVKVCDNLYEQNLINGTITFGTSKEYTNFKHPKLLIKNYLDATHEQVREVFNKCSVFVMPSRTEGLNLTPIESTLCGCPAVICDGAIGDVFLDGKTCLIAEKDNFSDILEKTKELLSNSTYSVVFKNNIQSLLSKFTWGNTISNIERVLK
jgi:glycosyltransferase involved in cell wall biosynthesis